MGELKKVENKMVRDGYDELKTAFAAVAGLDSTGKKIAWTVTRNNSEFSFAEKYAKVIKNNVDYFRECCIACGLDPEEFIASL